MNEAKSSGDTPACNSVAMACASGNSRRPRQGRIRQELRDRTTQWNENPFGQWKSLPRLGDDERITGFQRLSQNPLALPLRVDVRRVEKGNTGIRRSHNQREAFPTRATRRQ
jgi:hypothetical protein